MTEWRHTPGEILKFFIVAALSACAVLASVISLERGIPAAFPFLYILPIILVVYFYPRKAGIFTFCISVLFISIVYLMGSSNPSLIALSTAWFSILILIGIVASSYANRYHDEKARIRHILDNAQEGILCIAIPSCRILGINARCADWLRYDRQELIDKDLQQIWHDDAVRTGFCERIAAGEAGAAAEGIFVAKDGAQVRLSISVILRLGDKAICSVMDTTPCRIADDEIRETLDDLEAKIRVRTAHLEKINEELRAEIMERRKSESALLQPQVSSEEKKGQEKKGQEKKGREKL